MQPVYLDEHDTARFRPNVLVQYLLDNGAIDMNKLAHVRAPDDDRQQFAQLIGYSVGGYGDLPYCDDEVYNSAAKVTRHLKDAK